MEVFKRDAEEKQWSAELFDFMVEKEHFMELTNYTNSISGKHFFIKLSESLY